MPKINEKRGSETKEEGSITVFLCFLFLMFFSLIGATYENVRVLSGNGYMKVAANAAAMTVFGSYNKELYEQYGLFGYGGYDGITAADLEEEFAAIVAENIKVWPEKQKERYYDLYQIREVACEAEEVTYLTEEAVFCEQLKGYLKGEGIKKLKKELTSHTAKDDSEQTQSGSLALAKQYEEGEFDEIKKEQNAKKNSTASQTSLEGTNGKKPENTIDGNPLKSFTSMMKNGVLNLVCDSNRISKVVIENGESKNTESKSKNASDYMRDIIGDSGEMTKPAVGSSMTDKLWYIAYVDKQFSSYTKNRKRTAAYGLEYLVKGAAQERDNLSSTVGKLLGTRTLLNFAYVVSDPVLQEKSLATATALAGFTGMPPVIQAVQYLILLILAFEEACVDVTALLAGDAVPLVKTKSTMKMCYEEICLASKALFASKAKAYHTDKACTDGITYQQYLKCFLLMVDQRTLHTRTCNLIQFDLRHRYNQSFCIDTAICGCRYEMSYQIPFVFQNLPFVKQNMKQKNMRSLEVEYAYKSK